MSANRKAGSDKIVQKIDEISRQIGLTGMRAAWPATSSGLKKLRIALKS